MLQLYWPACGMEPISKESEWNESEACSVQDPGTLGGDKIMAAMLPRVNSIK